MTLVDKSLYSLEHPYKLLKTHKTAKTTNMPAMPVKVRELKKGGKPAQVKGACDLVLEQNKEFLKAFFSGEAPAEPLMACRAKTFGVEPEKSVASAGLQGYGGSRVVNVSVTFGTAVDYLIQTESGGLIVVPPRFLNQKGSGIHPQLFKVGDVILTQSGSCEKTVNIGAWDGEMAVGVRGWAEVSGWIPADKVDRAIKEKRLVIHDHAKAVFEAEALKRKADEAVAAAAAATMAGVAALRAAAAAAGGGSSEDEVGNWYD